MNVMLGIYAVRCMHLRLREVKVLKIIFYGARGLDVNAMMDAGFAERDNAVPAVEDGSIDDAAEACHVEQDAMHAALARNIHDQRCSMCSCMQ